MKIYCTIEKWDMMKYLECQDKRSVKLSNMISLLLVIIWISDPYKEAVVVLLFKEVSTDWDSPPEAICFLITELWSLKYKYPPAFFFKQRYFIIA